MFPEHSRSCQCCHVRFCIAKIKLLTICIFQKFCNIFHNLLRCLPSVPICFLASRDFCCINLVVSSSLQKVSTILSTLDLLSAGLALWGMMIEITAPFMVDLTLALTLVSSVCKLRKSFAI